MELPTGITGFSRRKSTELESDLRTFQECSYTAAYLTGSRIASTELPANYPLNYARVTFEFFSRGVVSERLCVLLNNTYPYVAFVTPMPSGDTTTHFIDHQRLAEAYRSFNRYTVLGATKAQTPLELSDYQNLHKVELRQIQYWQPKTVGEVIFNFWD